jgi:hypothetical protein
LVITGSPGRGATQHGDPGVARGGDRAGEPGHVAAVRDAPGHRVLDVHHAVPARNSRRGPNRSISRPTTGCPIAVAR